MILKSYEINKINQNVKNIILFYGKNEGLKNEALNILVKNKKSISNYEEKEILDNENVFIENILSKSLFEEEKIIVIKRATDKILKIIEILHLKNLDDTSIIINSDNFLPTTDLPDAAGPSIAIDLKLFIMISLFWNIYTHNIKNKP